MTKLIPANSVLAGGAALSIIWSIIISAAALLSVSTAEVLGGCSPGVLTLKRAFPLSQRVDVGELKARDRVRHSRFLQSLSSVVDFPVSGSFDPLYFTTLQIGSPARDFHVQIDSGSDVLWVSCSGCSGCPTTTGLPQLSLNFFDTSTSKTAKTISCSDKRCGLGSDSTGDLCSSDKSQCGYQFQYGDGSGTSGYYVYDLLHLNTVENGNVQNTSNAFPIIFGCSTVQSGALTRSDRAVDGIFGFGQQPMSVISQLAAQGAAPRAFSHCLRGDSKGGGILVFGEIVEPGMVYTPVVAGQSHYSVNLQSISVNGQTLLIDSSVFATSSTSGTIIDSGTTLAYFGEGIYEPFVNAITDAVSGSQSVLFPTFSKGSQCYVITGSGRGRIDEIFPHVSLNFQGGASMVLKPGDYLLEQNPMVSDIPGDSVWCLGIQLLDGARLSILGDVVLKDKAVVYDIAGQRVGWVNYDCSSMVNVSVNTKSSTDSKTYINTGQISDGSPRKTSSYLTLILTAIPTLLLHLSSR